MDGPDDLLIDPADSSALLRVNRQALYETLRLHEQMRVLVEAVRRLEQRQAMDSLASAISVSDVEIVLGCSRSRVFQLIREGKLQKARSIGRKAMVTKTSVEALQAMNLPQEKPRRAPKMDLAEELEFLNRRREARRGRRDAPT